jgi:uncharacterized membrane protein YhaH (DUF805 family)
MKTCPNCAKDNYDDARFCQYCGKEIVKSQAIDINSPAIQRTKWEKLTDLLFSSKGRISRMTLWKYTFAILGITIGFYIVPLLLTPNSSLSDSILSVWYCVFLLFSLFVFITQIIIIIKRCHDLNWSGWRILWSVVPFASIIFSILIAFEKGTDGPNKYGPDPTIH